MATWIFSARSVMIASVAAFVVALYVTLAWRAFMARRIWRAGATMQIAKVSAYQMALLQGGIARVALTSVVVLIGRKALVAGIAGVLTHNREFRGLLDVVEDEAIAAARKPAMLKDFLIQLETRLKRRGVIKQLRGELAAMGYMRIAGSKGWWQNYLANMLPFMAVIGAAIGSFFRLPLAMDARIWLIEFCAASTLAMALIALPTRVTAFGRYIVWSALQHHPDLKTVPAPNNGVVDIKALGRAVSLYGPDSLASSDMAWIPAVLEHVESAD
jgi:uncharacterized protein (TIGR04222 family)